MSFWWLILILVAFILMGVAFAVIFAKLDQVNKGQKKVVSYEDQTKQEVEHVFDNAFREEMRNRGRLHFEKIIGENAMFLQQDLRLTTSQLNDYMKNEITVKLKDEFAKYEKSIMDAKTMAMDSIKKTNDAIEEERAVVSQEVQKQILVEKKQIIDKFEKNMADIINHYVVEAIGNQIDLNDQLEHILGDLEANKEAIREDIGHGA
ncbi:hypothetical protein EBZ57_01255 [bacterium]|jgi:hypothetical protein|nr:hypothetical protein [bacterium]